MKSADEIKAPAVGKFIRFTDALAGKPVAGEVVGSLGHAHKVVDAAGELHWFNYAVGDRITYYANKPYRDRAARKQGDTAAAIAKSMRETAILKRRILERYAFVALGLVVGVLIGLAF